MNGIRNFDRQVYLALLALDGGISCSWYCSLCYSPGKLSCLLSGYGSVFTETVEIRRTLLIGGRDSFWNHGTLQIYNITAFAGPSWDGDYPSLAEVLKHEFIPEGISVWPNPVWPPPLGHDLSGFPGYDRIMEACR